MSNAEILTLEQVEAIRLTLPITPWSHSSRVTLFQLCASHEALRKKLTEIELGFQEMSTERDMEQIWRQDIQADLRELAEAIIEYRMAENPHDLDSPEMQLVTKALDRPDVQRLLAAGGER